MDRDRETAMGLDRVFLSEDDLGMRNDTIISRMSEGERINSNITCKGTRQQSCKKDCNRSLVLEERDMQIIPDPTR
jgi:hypothetical protein